MDARQDFKEDMIVINTKTNKRGTVVLDQWNVCSSAEVPVQYEGEQGYLGTDWQDLCLFELDIRLL
jgi:hypothetical protein